jgi:hypothetical protein
MRWLDDIVQRWLVADMENWTLPQVLNQPIPRRVTPSDDFKMIVILVSLFLVGGAALLTLLVFAATYKIGMLEKRGVGIEGLVIELRIDPNQGRTKGEFYDVDYQFELIPASAGGKSTYRATDRVRAEIAQQMRTGQRVPVLYDPLYPERSALNFDDRVHKHSSAKRIFSILGLLAAMFGIPYSIIVTVLFLGYRREKRLLESGCATAATILSEKNTRFILRPVATVTYEFSDALGVAIQGARKNLPRKATERNENFREFRARIFNNPTVLYDPHDSRLNMLYPPSWAVCAPPLNDEKKPCAAVDGDNHWGAPLA